MEKQKIKEAISDGKDLTFYGNAVGLCMWNCKTGVRCYLKGGSSYALTEGDLSKVEEELTKK